MVQKKQVKRIVQGQAETKFRTYFSGATQGVTDPGSYGGRAYVVKNQTITSNVTDIHRLIPQIAQGVSDGQRIGDFIKPVSLTVDMTVKINLATMVNYTPTDITAVVYFLQHATLKNYTSLAAQNNFNQLLDVGDGNQAAFNGDIWGSQLPVAKMSYRLLAKRVIPLRYAGALGQPGLVSIANAHDYKKSFSLNLTKHLPKTLKYLTTSATNDPENSSIFMCCAFYWTSGLNPGTTSLQNLMDIQYSSKFMYKDS